MRPGKLHNPNCIRMNWGMETEEVSKSRGAAEEPRGGVLTRGAPPRVGGEAAGPDVEAWALLRPAYAGLSAHRSPFGGSYLLVCLLKSSAGHWPAVVYN